MCLPTADAFMQYKLTCPLGSVYSHAEQQCTTAPTYKCLSNYTCKAIGNYEDVDSENCTSYVACVMGLIDIVAARRMECPVSLVFSPGVGCVNETEYVCNAQTTVVTEVANNAVVTENTGDFQSASEIPLNRVGGVRSCVLVVVLLVSCLIISI